MRLSSVRTRDRKLHPQHEHILTLAAAISIAEPGETSKNSHASWVEQGVEADWWKCFRAKGHSLGCLSQGLHLLQLIGIFSASRLQHYGCSCDYREHSLTQYDYKTLMQCMVGGKLLSIIYMNIRFKHAVSIQNLNYDSPA